MEKTKNPAKYSKILKNTQKKSADLVVNRLMVAFVSVCLLIFAVMMIRNLNTDKSLYFSVLPVLLWVLLGLFIASAVYFIVLRIMKIDESGFIVRSYMLMGVFAVLIGGFTLWRYMKIKEAQMIGIYVFFAVLYFVCSILANKARVKKN